jgi:hypothetical protein
MSLLSVDLACRSWSDLGVVLVEQIAFPNDLRMAREITCWQDPAPPVVELALRLKILCLERGAGV